MPHDPTNPFATREPLAGDNRIGGVAAAERANSSSAAFGPEGAWFGGEDEGWDLDRTGRVGIALFSQALQVWSVCQGRPVSVAEAAAAFRAPPDAVVEAVEAHGWMWVEGPPDDYARMMIAHEGE